MSTITAKFDISFGECYSDELSPINLFKEININEFHELYFELVTLRQKPKNKNIILLLKINYDESYPYSKILESVMLFLRFKTRVEIKPF